MGNLAQLKGRKKKLEVTENQVIQEQHAGGCMWMPPSFLFAVNSFYFSFSRAVRSLVFSVHCSSLSFFIFIAQWIECVILHWQAPKKPRFCWVTLSKSPNCFNRVLLFASTIKKKKNFSYTFGVNIMFALDLQMLDYFCISVMRPSGPLWEVHVFKQKVSKLCHHFTYACLIPRELARALWE